MISTELISNKLYTHLFIHTYIRIWRAPRTATLGVVGRIIHSKGGELCSFFVIWSFFLYHDFLIFLTEICV